MGRTGAEAGSAIKNSSYPETVRFHLYRIERIWWVGVSFPVKVETCARENFHCEIRRPGLLVNFDVYARRMSFVIVGIITVFVIIIWRADGCCLRIAS